MSTNMQKNYVWNMIGSIASALVSTVLLLLASRNLDSVQSDILSITYSLSQQLFIIGLFQVRNFQATDTKEVYSFPAYFYTRLLTIGLMIGATGVFIAYSRFSPEKAFVLWMIVLTRALDALSDVFQGYYQQHNQSLIAGKLLFFRSMATIGVFGLVIMVTRSLEMASTSIFLAALFLIFVLEGRYFHLSSLIHKPNLKVQAMGHILKECFPLFLNGFLITYIFTEPKLVIDQFITAGSLQAGMQRDFNILFMPTFILNLLFTILRPLITELAYHWTAGQTKKFFRQITLVSLILVAIGAVGSVVAYAIGTPLLSLVFGVNITSYRLELLLLIVAGVFNVLATMIDSLVTIFRKQSYLLVVYFLTFGVSKLLTTQMIAAQGMTGAATSFLITMMIYCLLSLLIFLILIKKMTPPQKLKQ